MRASVGAPITVGAAVMLIGAAWWAWARRARHGPVIGTGGAGVPAPVPVAESVLEFVTVTAKKILPEVLPRGLRNNNPGNIRWISLQSKRWQGMTGQDGGGYAIFDSVQNGVRALGRELLLDEKRGLKTVRAIIGNWAPASENDTSAYVSAVARALNVGPDAVISVKDRLPELAAAIIRHENGINPYTQAQLSAWVALP